MATKTPNYNLNKPAQTDFYNIDVQNENMDKIDEALYGKVDAEIGKGLSTNDYNDIDKEKVKNLPDNISTELDGKTNQKEFQEHIEDKNLHSSSTEKQSWDEKMEKVTSATEGNFPVLKNDGSLEDSGKKANDFLTVEHGIDSIVSEAGVHDLRYYNSEFQVKNDSGEWVKVESNDSHEFDELKNTVSNIQTTVTEDSEKISSIEVEQSEQNSKIEELETKNTEIENRVTTSEKAIAELKQNGGSSSSFPDNSIDNKKIYVIGADLREYLKINDNTIIYGYNTAFNGASTTMLGNNTKPIINSCDILIIACGEYYISGKTNTARLVKSGMETLINTIENYSTFPKENIYIVSPPCMLDDFMNSVTYCDLNVITSIIYQECKKHSLNFICGFNSEIKNKSELNDTNFASFVKKAIEEKIFSVKLIDKNIELVPPNITFYDAFYGGNLLTINALSRVKFWCDLEGNMYYHIYCIVTGTREVTSATRAIRLALDKNLFELIGKNFDDKDLVSVYNTTTGSFYIPYPTLLEADATTNSFKFYFSEHFHPTNITNLVVNAKGVALGSLKPLT